MIAAPLLFVRACCRRSTPPGRRRRRRQAMARTRTWTAPAVAVERERSVQIARIGNNLNQIARWANANASAAEAVTVIANLVSFERSLLTLARFGGDGGDAH